MAGRRMALLAALAGAVAGVVVGFAVVALVLGGRGNGGAPAPADSGQTAPVAGPSGAGGAPSAAVATPAAAATPSPSPSPSPSPVALADGVGAPYGSATGLLMFRGNPTRTWYGTGPAPRDPAVRWRYPDQPLCGLSTVGSETTEWCGSGWTGQPAVWEHDGTTEVVFGAYDHAVHFVDAATGAPTRPSFPTGDIIKGSVTIDPDGFPLLYTGSRDDFLRVIALDRDQPTELYRLGAHPEGIWNDDWDGNPIIVDDVLFEGGEDGFLHVVRLNRGRDAEGLVTVDPEVLAEVPLWDGELISAVGDRNMSIESSLVIRDDVVYAVNSGGRISGLSIPALLEGREEVVFTYWLGDDADATMVSGPEGELYATVELERGLARAGEVGQLVRLDPSRPDDPRIWGLDIPAAPVGDGKGGAWSTPAWHDGRLYLNTHAGELLAVDAATGEVVWRDELGSHEWSSPVVVDGTLVTATCEDGGMQAYDLAGALPVPTWRVDLESGSCIESTPAMWEGVLYVGSRDGHLYAFGD